MITEAFIVQIIIFAGVGVWNTFFDFTIFWILINSLDKLEAVRSIKYFNVPAISHFIAFTIANVTSFFLNSHFTFRGGNENPSIVTYFVITFFSLLISTALVNIYAKDKYLILFQEKVYNRFVRSRKIKNLISLDEKRWASIVKLGTVGVTLVINFVGYKIFVF
jgi:putative flippase GtrA